MYKSTVRVALAAALLAVAFVSTPVVAQNAGISSLLCLLYTSPSPRDGLLSRMPSSA